MEQRFIAPFSSSVLLSRLSTSGTNNSSLGQTELYFHPKSFQLDSILDLLTQPSTAFRCTKLNLLVSVRISPIFSEFFATLDVFAAFISSKIEGKVVEKELETLELKQLRFITHHINQLVIR